MKVLLKFSLRNNKKNKKESYKTFYSYSFLKNLSFSLFEEFLLSTFMDKEL